MGSSKFQRQIPKHNPNSVKLCCTHLRDIPIPKPHPGEVSLIIGADFPKLLLKDEYKGRKQFEPFAPYWVGNYER